MKILNQIRSTLLCFRASRYQGSGQYEKVIELGLKADKLTPNDDVVAVILYSAYSSSKQWKKAVNIASHQLEKKPFDLIWNKRMAETLCHLNKPIKEIKPYLQIYVDEVSKKGSQNSDLGWQFKFILFIFDVLLWPFFLMRKGKGEWISIKVNSSMRRGKKRDDLFYDWAIKQLGK